MKKRSILAILLAALLALTIFTGCAASTKSASADSAAQAPAAEMPMEEPAAAEEFAYAGRFRCRLYREDHLYRLRLHRDDRV